MEIKKSDYKEVTIERPHWTSRKLRPRDRYLLDRNENCDSVWADFIQGNFLASLRARHIVEYPDIRGGYRALSELTNIPHRQLFLTAGSEQGIRAIIEANMDWEDISIPEPTFAMAEVYAQIYGLQVKKYPYKYYKRKFHIELEPSQITYIASPDNPTGHVFDYSTVIDACEASEVVILDECYHEFSHYDVTSLVSEYDNLYILRSFSKAGGVAGLRVGYIISSIANIDCLYQKRPMYEIGSIGCEYVKMMSRFPDTLAQSAHCLIEGKKMLELWLRNNEYIVPHADGNFTLVEYNEELAKVLDQVIVYKTVHIDKQKFIRITSANKRVMQEIIDHVSGSDIFSSSEVR